MDDLLYGNITCQQSSLVAEPPRKVKVLSEETKKRKRESDRARARTRINIGPAYTQWRELKEEKGLKTDGDLALMLLDLAGGALPKPSEVEPQTVVGADETVHRETPSEHQEEDTFEFPNPVSVQCEDDLIGKRACIAYEECLRKLGTFLRLPIQKCPHVDPITKTKCSCCSPFQVGISRRGTAFIMEWCCSNGHSLWKWNSQPLLKFVMQSGDFMLSTSILLSGNSYTKVAMLFKHMNMGMMVDTTLQSTQETDCADSIKDFWQKKRAEVLAQRKEKDSVIVPEFPEDVQQLQIKEEPSWQQDWSCSLHQGDAKPQHIKEEQDEFWGTVQDREQLQGLEEADSNTIPFNVVAVKNEDDEEGTHLLQLNQRQTDEMETGANVEDCGGPEPDRISHPESFSTPEIEVKIEDSSEPETGDREIYTCSECGKRFNCQENLIRHKVVHTGGKPFCCSDCGKRFTLKHHLIRHRVVHTGEKPFCCSECGRRFVQKSDLTCHIAKHRKEKLFSCCECGKGFNRKPYLMAHMLHHSKLKPFSCSECGKSYADKRRLSRHMRIHTGGKPFSCSECGKQFKEKSLLIRHMMIHTGEKPFSCSNCDKRFNQKSSLTRHMMSHTGEKALSCTECGKQFKTKYILTGHMRIHTGEKPFSCSECGKRFSRKFYLKSHMALHKEEKPYSCSECGKRFNQKSGLTTHMQYHRTEKLFSCSECSQRYTVKRNLDRHMLVHTGERPFSCSVCSKTFKQQAHLTSHMLVHTEEKPYSCSHCSKRFYRKWHLSSHMLVHTVGREKPYSCSVCDRRFTWWSKLKKHECVGGQASELQKLTKEGEREEADTGDDGDGCGGSLQERSSDLKRLLQPETEIKTEFYDL